MKKLSALFFFSFLSCLFFASNLQAQTAPEDYFAGTWNVKAYGLPQGDTDMRLFNLKRKMVNLPEVSWMLPPKK